MFTNIKDEPLLGCRQLILDESRHFFDKEKVKQIIDLMTTFQLHRFPWLLPDEFGWCIEIKAFPKQGTIAG